MLALFLDDPAKKCSLDSLGIEYPYHPFVVTNRIGPVPRRWVRVFFT